MPERRSEYELDERAAEARFILNNPIFLEAVEGLRSRYIKNLMSSGIATEQAMVSHAKMVVLEELISQIGAAITDQKMTQQRKPNYGN
jgi:hypothetical protein